MSPFFKSFRHGSPSMLSSIFKTQTKRLHVGIIITSAFTYLYCNLQSAKDSILNCISYIISRSVRLHIDAYMLPCLIPFNEPCTICCATSKTGLLLGLADLYFSFFSYNTTLISMPVEDWMTFPTKDTSLKWYFDDCGEGACSIKADLHFWIEVHVYTYSCFWSNTYLPIIFL